MKNYKSIDYAAGRLVGTVVRVDGKAAYIEKLSAKKVTYSDFVNGPVTGSIDKLDITPVPLGYCNTMGTVAYLMRYSVRKDWKQGLRHHTLQCLSKENLRSDMIPWLDVFKTINGDFPKFEEVIKLLHDNKGIKGQAYCRDFAIHANMDICYKGQFVIGKVEDINAHDGVARIDEKFEWIREAFEASVIW